MRKFSPGSVISDCLTRIRNLEAFYIVHIVVAISWLVANFLFAQEFYEDSTTSPRAFISVLLLLFACYYMISSVTRPIPLVFLLVNSLFFIIASVVNYFKFYYKIIISVPLIQSTVNTDISEVSELLNISLFTWIILFGLIPTILIIFLAKKKVNISVTIYLKSILFAIALILLSCLISPSAFYAPRFLMDSSTHFMPMNYGLGFRNYWLANHSTIPAKDITETFTFSMGKEHKNLNVILVIGESLRSDRLGINGYKRNTTSGLAKIDNLLSYKNVYSLATNTPLGVQNITKKHGFYDFSSFVKIFGKLGFKTHWLSNQGISYKMINAIAMEAEKRVFSDDIRIAEMGSNYDVALLPYLKDTLSAGGSNLIILHTNGSHKLYDLRYPPEFKIFKPTCIDDGIYYSFNECLDSEKLGNSYDNTILYTDYFLTEVIKILERKNAILLYISDHGESLGENGVYGHSRPVESGGLEQRHVPMLLWASKDFLSKKTNLTLFNNAKAKLELKLDHTNIFHSILDCSGIISDSIDLDKSICAKTRYQQSKEH